MIRKLEVLANLAVVITSIILCSVLVKRYYFSTAKQEAAPDVVQLKSRVSNEKRQSIQAGTKVSLAGIDWSKSSRTVLLALSTTCHFCTESAPFYQKLQQQKPDDVSLVAVLPQPVDDSRNYLNKLGISVHRVVQAPLASVGVSGTPTLLLIDHDGAVGDSWVGKLSDTEAAKVIARIRE